MVGLIEQRENSSDWVVDIDAGVVDAVGVAIENYRVNVVGGVIDVAVDFDVGNVVGGAVVN